MQSASHRSFRPARFLGVVAGLVLVIFNVGGADPVAPKPADIKNEFITVVQQNLKKYCLDCHSTKAKKGSLDLDASSRSTTSAGTSSPGST